jgi:SAM-dependent methyltransferase
MADREQLRQTFDAVAERYAAIRPGYLPATVDDLVELAGLAPGDRVLEIGCGTGQLTVPLAERGLVVTAVELGAGLAAVARRRLADHPTARVLVGAFEDVELEPGSFDLVVAATAFHWIDPAVRLPRSAELLRPGGALAVIDTVHVAGGTERFWADVQGCYERWDAENTPPGLRPSPARDVPTARPELDGSALFAPAVLRRYEWDARYTTAQYRELLLTYSNHLAMPDPDRDGLLGCVGSLMDTRFGGAVTKHYLTELRVSHRRPG